MIIYPKVYLGTMVPNHLLHVGLFYIQALWYPIMSEPQLFFLYRYQNCHHSCAQSVHTYKFQFLLDLCTRFKMLPSLIFLCQGCRRCLNNLPLKILSCLRSCSHQIKMAFTYRDINCKSIALMNRLILA